MPQPDLQTAKQRIERLSQRLGTRTRDFAEHGGFSDIHNAYAQNVRRRAEAGPYPTLNLILSGMLLQFLFSSDRASNRGAPKDAPEGVSNEGI
jgi:hypothetical protein